MECDSDHEDQQEQISNEALIAKMQEQNKLTKSDTTLPNLYEKLNKKHQYYHNCGYAVHHLFGLLYINSQLISAQRKIAVSLLTKIGSNVLMGKSIIETPLPTTISCPSTFMTSTLIDYSYAPYYIDKASSTTDIFTRIKCIIAMITASIHLNICQYKPFTPLLGETVEATLGKDAQTYCEHVSDSPPTNIFQIYGKDYRIYGTQQYEIKWMPNTVIYNKKGYVYIVLFDESKYRIELPSYRCEGILFGKRIMRSTGDYTVEDLTNKLYSRVRIYPEKRGMLRSLFQKQKDRKDHIRGYITKDQKSFMDYNIGIKNTSNEQIDGHWIEELSISNQTYWEIDVQECSCLTSNPKHLPSDSNEREDIKALQNQSYELANVIC